MAITNSKTTTASTVAELGEHALIAHIRSLLTMPDWVYLGPGDDAAILEQEPLERVAQMGELMAFRHEGFWQCMDTKRDKDKLNKALNSKKIKF